MPTAISDLWVPQIWVQGLSEKAASFPSIITSGIANRDEEFDAYAAGPGTTINLPYFRDISDQADAVQVENTQATRQVIGSGKQIAAICNRETANDLTALSGQVSGAAPVDGILTQLAIRRQKQRNTTLLNQLRGLFDTTSAPNSATGCLKAARYDIFLEAGATPPATQCISASGFVDAVTLLGEQADVLKGGSIIVHPDIHQALLKADQISFEHFSLQEGIKLQKYRGLWLWRSKLLRRAGTTSGYVYDTYLSAPGVFAWGEKPQQGDVVDVASLSYWMDKQKNNEEIYDRSRFILHPNGCRWVGTPAGQSATNAEFATAANWNLDYQTADRVGLVCMRTNG